jgi:hypothetical protein
MDKREDLEMLRLLRAFHKIKDAAMRRAIVRLVEDHAAGRTAFYWFGCSFS